MFSSTISEYITNVNDSLNTIFNGKVNIYLVSTSGSLMTKTGHPTISGYAIYMFSKLGLRDTDTLIIIDSPNHSWIETGTSVSSITSDPTLVSNQFLLSLDELLNSENFDSAAMKLINAVEWVYLNNKAVYFPEDFPLVDFTLDPSYIAKDIIEPTEFDSSLVSTEVQLDYTLNSTDVLFGETAVNLPTKSEFLPDLIIDSDDPLLSITFNDPPAINQNNSGDLFIIFSILLLILIALFVIYSLLKNRKNLGR
jgi:hypothetical protein